MIIAKQKNIKIFHIQIDDFDAFEKFFSKNAMLVKNYLIILDGNVTPEVKALLDKAGAVYIQNSAAFPKFSLIKKDTSESDTTPAQTKPQPQAVTQNTTNSEPPKQPACSKKIIDKTLRSGTEIEHAGPVAIFGRINNGARVVAQGELEVFGDIDGLVECEGAYMIVKGVVNGSIIFNGEIVEPSLFDGSLKKISTHENKLVVEEL